LGEEGRRGRGKKGKREEGEEGRREEKFFFSLSRIFLRSFSLLVH
jgi:hypothetical protein